MLIDILPTVILRCGHLPPVPRALASLAAGVGSDAGADAAQRVDGHAEEVGHIVREPDTHDETPLLEYAEGILYQETPPRVAKMRGGVSE